MAKQTPGSKCDTGSKYELSVTALFASFLSKNENIKDYRIFSNLADAHPFDDIVAEVHFRGLEQKHIYAIQVKSGRDKLNINKYRDGFHKIIGEGGIKLGENVRNDCIHFWYFCSKSSATKTFTVTINADTVDLKLQPRSRPHHLYETIFDKTVSHKLFSENSDMTDHQYFLESFYLFFNQPTTDKIIYIIKGIWNIDNPWLILQYLDNYLAKSSNGLDKATFEHELLKIRLSDYVVTPTAVIALQRSAVDEWNWLTLISDVTIVQNKTNIEPYLFGCILQNISHLINIEEWNWAVDNLGKLDRDLKNRLKTTSFKADTLRELIFQAWVCRRTPLLLKTDTPLPLLKEFSHLRKCYIVIDSNIDRRYKEINSYDLRGFRHLNDVEAYELMKVISVSLQGREPVTLHEIINEDEKLKEATTCFNIIDLIKPRAAHLRRECLDGCNYILFIIETADLQQPQQDEYRPTDGSMAIYCGLDESDSTYAKYRPKPEFKNYKILCVRLTDDGKLKLLPTLHQEDYRDLECFFVDEDGESVFYNTMNGSITPVIGEVLIRTDTHFRWKYVPRYLREAIERDEVNSSNEVACSKPGIEYSKKTLTERNFLKKSRKKVNVITGEPGMGKTTLLHSLFGFCESEYYVLFVDLARIRGDLLSGKLKSFRHLLNFSRNKCRSLPYSCLLDDLHSRTNRLVLILDSFDEIIATCERQVLKLVKSVRDADLENVIIASRLTALNSLTDNCEAKIFKLKGLKQSDRYYTDNWNLDMNELRWRIPSEFLTIPLYLKMLRTLSENGMNLEVVNEWNLYEGILKLRMEDYSLRNCPSEDEKQYILAKHGELALNVIFGINSVTEKIEHGVRPNNSHFIKLGFITHFDNESLAFVHRTFAEFFVVKWLIWNVGRDDAGYIYKLMLDDKRENILYRYSETFPLHKAILLQDIDKVQRLYRKDQKCLLETDDFGRSALHLAATISDPYSKNMLNFFIQRMRTHGCDLHARDKIIKWTWMDYFERQRGCDYLYAGLPIREAYFNYYATHIEELVHCKYSISKHFNELYNDAVVSSSIGLVHDLLFLKYHKNKSFLEFREMCLGSRELEVNRMELPEERLKNVHLACIYGNIEVVRAYIDSGADFTETDEYNCTPLHYCVIAKQGEMLKLILDAYGILNPYAGCHNDTTVLNMSVRTGDVNIMKMLLEWLDIQVIEEWNSVKQQYHALKLAIECEHNEMVAVLLHRLNPNRIKRLFTLRLAIRKGNNDIIKTLSNYGTDINAEEEANGFGTPLYFAIKRGRVHIVQAVLENGADVNYVDRDGWTPLAYTICNAHQCKDIVEIFLDYGADVNLKGKDGETPLYVAIKEEKIEMIKLLLTKGARLDCLNSRGWTPLIFAVKRGRQEIVEMLLDGVNFRGKHGITPLCEAIKEARTDMFITLSVKQSNANYVDEYGLSPLIIATKSANTFFAETLCMKGADVNFKNEYGVTALYAAAIRRNLAMVEFLLRRGADVNVATSGEEILRKAKGGKKMEIVFWLLKDRIVGPLTRPSNSSAANVIERVTQNWPRINLQDELRAAVNQQSVNFEILKEYGSEIHLEDEFWKTVFSLINEMNDEKLDNAFFRSLDSFEFHRLIDKVCTVATDASLDIINVLLRHRKYVANFLETAIEFQNKGVIEIILKSVDVRTIIFDGTTPLHIGVLQQNIDIVQMLLEHGSPIDPIDYYGLTPLLYAVKVENIKMVEILLVKGADVNFEVKNYRVTALHIAAMKENRSMVRTLLHYGASKNVKIFTDLLVSDLEERIAFELEEFSGYGASEIIEKVKRIIEEELIVAKIDK